jgi:hypothetical protein
MSTALLSAGHHARSWAGGSTQVAPAFSSQQQHAIITHKALRVNDMVFVCLKPDLGSYIAYDIKYLPPGKVKKTPAAGVEVAHDWAYHGPLR